jgi:hypothetical protein
LMAQYEAELKRVRPVSFHHTYLFIKHHFRPRPSHSPRTTKISERIVLHRNFSRPSLLCDDTPFDDSRSSQTNTIYNLLLIDQSQLHVLPVFIISPDFRQTHGRWTGRILVPLFCLLR